MTDALTRLQASLADRYRVERELGSGGMATVYLAHDVRHERKVAVKVLRAELSAVLGAERFLNEIRVTANLQHPHILQLFDSGAADGLLYYVMPYVDGESLRERLARERQLAVDEAVEITRAVASALDYAHRHGVVHRDIKPENILLHERQPLVADFGIALAVSAAGGNRITETGLSLGTPHYMSPEQATGDRALDGRSDIYSLGCVAYEMLAGQPPHTGPTSQAIIAKIVTENAPRVTLARPAVPPHVEAAIHTAIQKLHADRFHTAAEFAEALTRPLAGGSTVPGFAAAPAAPARATRGIGWRAAAGIALVSLALGAVGSRLGSSRPPAAPPLTRFSIEVAPATLSGSAQGPVLGLSADGSQIAFAGTLERRQIFIRGTGDSLPRAVTGTDFGLAPFFSPDGRWLGFWTAGKLFKVPVEGGVPVQVADSAGLYAVWLEDGAIAYTSRSQRELRIARGDGEHRLIVRSDTSLFVGLSALPGGRLLTTMSRGVGASTVSVLTMAIAIRISDGRITPIGLTDAITPRYVAPGFIVYQASLGGPLSAIGFNTRRLHVSGGARVIGPPARATSRIYSQWVAAGSTIAYLSFDPSQLVLTDRAGHASVLREEPRTYHHPRFSPDGRRIVLDITEQGARDLWIVDAGDRTMTRLTVGERANDAFWSPDGRRIAYTKVSGSSRGVFLRDPDGGGTADSVYQDGFDRSSGAWTPDGTTIISATAGLAGLWAITVATHHAELIAGSRPSEAFPALSPDGRWLAYVSDESGRSEVYVRPFPGPGGRRQISADGGVEPVWGRTGRELFYREDAGAVGQLVAAALRFADGGVEVAGRTRLFEMTQYEVANDHANYDIAPDGSRFVLVRTPRATPIHVIQNWPSPPGNSSRLP